ncbi:hypothetical protein IFR05_004903 [Cadophora sp. M221]|nr:hypothetical protein IFR05_004903 [Cadophora sp. M221]
MQRTDVSQRELLSGDPEEYFYFNMNCAPALRPEKHEIRLLTLACGSGQEPIRGTLHNTSLDRKLRFEALSYVWEDPGITRSIFVNRRQLQVTTNLEAALRNLGLESGTRTLWVDAICVNQKNLEERSSQVSLMAKIYSTCSLCIVWLGESAMWTEQALMILKQMASGEHVKSWNLDHSSSGTPIMPQDNSFHLAPFKDGLFAPLKYLSQRSWCSRTWTVQEPVLPSRVLMKCGDHEVDWNIISEAHKFLDDHLIKCGERFCSEFEQKDIDSLDAFKSAGIHIDSGASLLDCYAQPTPFNLKSSGGLRALGLALRDEPWNSLSSWVPDWSTDSEETMYSADRLDRYDLFGAAGDTEVIYSTAIPSTDHIRGQNTLTSEDRELVFSTHSCILSLRGIHRQTVVRTNYSTTQRFHSNSLAVIKSCFKLWLACKSTTTSGSDSRISPILPFIRTLLRDSVQPSDCTNPPRRATEVDYTACLLWWNMALEQRSINPLYTTEDETETTQLTDILWSLSDTVGYSRFFITDKGSIGLGPTSTKPRDEIWIVCGGKLPLILRENVNPGLGTGKICTSETYHSLVGDCYVDGIMDGEAVRHFSMDAEAVHIV